MKRNGNGNKRTAVILAAGLAALEAWGGAVGGVVKVAGKVAGHGADNAAEHVLARQAEAGGKGAAKALSKGGAHWGAKGGVLEKAVEGAAKTARAERKGVGAATILAAGGAVAAVDAAHNLSKGVRNRNEAIGEAEKRAIEENPGLVPEIRGTETRWKNIAAGGAAAALLAVALPFGLAAAGAGRGVRRALGALRRRRIRENGEKNGGIAEKRGQRALSKAEARKENGADTEELA